MGINRKARDNFFLVDSTLSSADYGIVISADNSFGAPKRDVEHVSVPGRNGDLIIDNGRWENIEVTYNDCLIEADFPEKFGEFRAQLSRMRGYKRLEDSFDPDIYRLANVSNIKLSKLGTIYHSGIFDVTFDCKPQRFLKSGEIAVQLMPWVPLTYRTQYIVISGDSVGYEAHIPAGDQITIKFSTYDSALTEFRSVTATCEDGDVGSFSIANPDEDERFWRLEITNGITDPEQVRLQLRFDLDYFASGIKHVNATFGQYFTLKNPTGYAAKPLIDYWAMAIPMTSWENYTNGELQFYYDFHSDDVPAANIFMSCDLQYLYDVDKNNLTSYLYLNTSGSGIGEGLVFPELSEDETKLDMYFTVSSYDKGPGIVCIYPNWWRL